MLSLGKNTIEKSLSRKTPGVFHKTKETFFKWGRSS